MPTSAILEEICDAGCEHALLLAPTMKLLRVLEKHGASWQEHAECFLALLEQPGVKEKLDKGLFAGPMGQCAARARPSTATGDRFFSTQTRGGGNIGIVHPHAR